MKKISLLLLFVSGILALQSCKKDDETGGGDNNGGTPSGNATVMFEVQSVDENEEGLDLGKVYVTPTGDSVTFDYIRYWISNIEFVKEDGSSWKEEKSYRLMEKTQSKNREEFSVTVPAGKYKSLRFGIGVDQARNSSIDSVAGELDVTAGMSWTWNTGYIFMKNEGTFYNSDSMAYTDWKYHLGTDANYKTVTLDFPMTQEFTDGSKFMAHVVYMALNIFSKPNDMDLKANPVLMVGPADQTAKAADNYAEAFELHHFKKQ